MTHFFKTSFFLFLFLSPINLLNAKSFSPLSDSFQPGETWLDDTGVHINAHGGAVLSHQGKYYWFGEHRPGSGFKTEIGVMCYSSSDLYNWKNEGVALSVVENKKSPIVRGCIIERPKVIYNTKTKKFVMYFHLELKNKGYEAAQYGVAVSNNITGPYEFIKAERVNSGEWAQNMTEAQIHSKVTTKDFTKWWTPEWFDAVSDGVFVRRDFNSGQMSRDMTLFVDDDGKAYHIYSSEENLTIHVAELSSDYLNHTGKYIRIDPGGHNEAPAVFKKDGRYFMITSGCTGWKPNEARLLIADNMLGTWKRYPNPCKGRNAQLTFRSQSTYVLPIEGKKDAFIFMADRWNPESLKDSRYIWLPILFEDGFPVLKWFDKWNLGLFDETKPDFSSPKLYDDYQLVWNDEFDYEGKPNLDVWKHENGFERNEEDQWYQPQNATCKDGVLIITGELEHRENPLYKENARDWRGKRQFIRYTSSSINTRGTKEFQYGRFEIRAKIPTSKGAWPAIWTLGVDMEWPSNGEIDIMEYYQINDKPHILANAAWGTDRRFNAKWNSKVVPFNSFIKKDQYWANKFHIWRMDWDEDAIRLYLDNELLNEIFLKDTYNASIGEYKNPFMQAHYILLNLAIGGINGGKIDDSAFPLKYEVDYVRVYQKKNSK